VEVLVQGVGLVAIVNIAAALADRLGLLSPIVLMVLGLVLSFVPGLPEYHLDPELVLVGILPPLLYVAAKEMSAPDFRFNLRPILLLAVGLVLFSAFAVALVVHAIMPDVPFAACLALGAVLAPPDAVAATSIARRVGLPRRVVTLLEGESLINDASALVLFRLAVAAASGASVGVGHIAADTAVAVGGGIGIGVAGAVVFGFLHRRVTDPLLDNALSLLTPFAVALVAEVIEGSAVVAVVITGLALGNKMPRLMSAASRLQMEFFWKIVNFLLQGLVFVLVGLQLRDILGELHTSPGTVFGVTAAVLGTLLVARFVWVYPATYLPRLIPRIRERDPSPPPSVPTVVGWAGMRGVVTLAAALALPLTLGGGRAYPRDLFIWIAFAVIVVTLLLHGLTLPMVARRLRLPADDPAADALAEAAVQHQASRVARERLEANADGVPAAVLDQLRTLTERRSNRAWERLGGAGRETPSQAYVRLRRVMLDAEREVFQAARESGRIADEVLRRAQRDMDLEESMLSRTERRVSEDA
jgi:CPA1 family monovalent cation:H+ antiporter